jgi:hypothetical protein
MKLSTFSTCPERDSETAQKLELVLDREIDRVESFDLRTRGDAQVIDMLRSALVQEGWYRIGLSQQIADYHHA